MTIYFIVSFLALLTSLPLGRAFICLSPASAVPLVLISLSIFQAVLFKSMENEQNDLHGLNYARAEIDSAAYRRGMTWHARTKLAVLPPMAVFVLYFSAPWKVLISTGLYVFSFVAARMLAQRARKE